jgi:hypothetical protein
MTRRSTVHDTFVINRAFAFGRELVFAACSSLPSKVFSWMSLTMRGAVSRAHWY